MSTIHDVARRAGVSAMTVSRVINNSGYVGKEARERVTAAIAELGYVPNSLARSLRFKHTKMLALVVSDITNPFFTTMARGVEDTARRHNFTVLFCNTDESESEQARYLTALVQRQGKKQYTCNLTPVGNGASPLFPPIHEQCLSVLERTVEDFPEQWYQWKKFGKMIKSNLEVKYDRQETGYLAPEIGFSIPDQA